MATSSVEICNDAIIILGGEKITSLAGTTKEAVLCNEQYDKVRKQLLSSHPWNFATYRANIAQDADVPTDWWDWEYAHSLPSDVLRVLGVYGDESLRWAVESGRKLFSDHTPVDIVYIKNVTDTTLFPAFFERALAFALAERLCYAMSQSTQLLESVKKDAEQSLREARSYDAQEKSLQRVAAEEFINARY